MVQYHCNARVYMHAVILAPHSSYQIKVDIGNTKDLDDDKLCVCVSLRSCLRLPLQSLEHREGCQARHCRQGKYTALAVSLESGSLPSVSTSKYQVPRYAIT